MAARKRSRSRSRKRTASTTRRRRVTRRKSPAVSLVRRGRTVYRSNPRKRTRRRSTRHRRNPPILAMIKQVAEDTVITTVGGAAQRMAGKVLPAMSNPLLEAAKGTAVAVAVGMVGRRFLGNDRARFLAAGAMLPVLKNVVTAYLPSAAGFLGDYEPMGDYSPAVPLGDPYPDGGYLAGIEPVSGLDTQDMGSYEIVP